MSLCVRTRELTTSVFSSCSSFAKEGIYTRSDTDEKKLSNHGDQNRELMEGDRAAHRAGARSGDGARWIDGNQHAGRRIRQGGTYTKRGEPHIRRMHTLFFFVAPLPRFSSPTPRLCFVSSLSLQTSKMRVTPSRRAAALSLRVVRTRHPSRYTSSIHLPPPAPPTTKNLIPLTHTPLSSPNSWSPKHRSPRLQSAPRVKTRRAGSSQRSSTRCR